MTSNIINLADRRPPAPRRPSRLQHLARRADGALCTLVVAAGICWIAWLPGHIVGLLAPDMPWYVSIFTICVPGVLVGIWAVLSVGRLRRSTAPDGCSVNVHVFEDEVATRCKCGATGDVDGGGAA